MDNNTCLRSDCLNWGILIIDANTVLYMMSASLAIIGEKSINPTWRLRLPEVLKVFEENLQKIKRCSCNGELYCSEPVLSEELNPNSLKIGACPTRQSRSVYNASERGAFNRIICNCFNNAVITIPDEVNELRGILRSQGAYLDDRDASLLLAACKVSQPETPTLIVSQDGHFEHPVELLVKMRNLSIQGQYYNTDQIVWRTYLSYILKAHDCCMYPSDIYERLYDAWCFTIPKRVANANPKLAERLQELFILTLPIMQKSVEYKSR